VYACAFEYNLNILSLHVLELGSLKKSDFRFSSSNIVIKIPVSPDNHLGFVWD